MFNTLLSMLYLYFHSIYLFHVILSLCLSSGPFTGFPSGLWLISAISFVYTGAHPVYKISNWQVCQQSICNTKVTVETIFKYSVPSWWGWEYVSCWLLFEWSVQEKFKFLFVQMKWINQPEMNQIKRNTFTQPRSQKFTCKHNMMKENLKTRAMLHLLLIVSDMISRSPKY